MKLGLAEDSRVQLQMNSNSCGHMKTGLQKSNRHLHNLWQMRYRPRTFDFLTQPQNKRSQKTRIVLLSRRLPLKASLMTFHKPVGSALCTSKDESGERLFTELKSSSPLCLEPKHIRSVSQKPVKWMARSSKCLHPQS